MMLMFFFCMHVDRELDMATAYSPFNLHGFHMRLDCDRTFSLPMWF